VPLPLGVRVERGESFEQLDELLGHPGARASDSHEVVDLAVGEVHLRI